MREGWTVKPYYSDAHVTLYHGDCRDVLPTLAHSETCITDPPYGLGFMGKDWDHAVPGVHFWELIGAALLPGASLLAFGGTRTFHRLTCAIEDAGFEIRDCLMWLYGSGFPKSLDVSKAIDKAAGAERDVTRKGLRKTGLPGQMDTKDSALRERRDDPASYSGRCWDGWGTALKPAWEPVVLAMKPLAGTFAENALRHGVAGLSIDGARVEAAGRPLIEKKVGHPDVADALYGKGLSPGSRMIGATDAGRWPANVLLDEEAAALLDAQSGEVQGAVSNGRRGVQGVYRDGIGTAPQVPGFNDSGGASRFFYTAKASRSERGEEIWKCNCETPRLGAWQRQDRSRSDPTDSTSPPKDTCADDSTGGCDSSITSSGNEQTVVSQGDTKSTTSTRTRPTTGSKTSDSSAQPSTSGSTADASSETERGGSPAGSAGQLSLSMPITGTSPERGGRYMDGVAPAILLKSSKTSVCADCGTKPFLLSHPTVKPLDLLTYLCKLTATPTGGTVLDPFAGSGTTLLAAKNLGRKAIGIELEERHCEIAAKRLAQQALDFGGAA